MVKYYNNLNYESVFRTVSRAGSGCGSKKALVILFVHDVVGGSELDAKQCYEV